LAIKVADRIAQGEDPVRLIARVLSKARTHGQVVALEMLGHPTNHLFDEVEVGSHDPF
jgi:DNA polymerase III delta subunit